MTSRQGSERTGRGEPAAAGAADDPAERPTVSLRTPEELAERRAAEKQRRRKSPPSRPPRPPRPPKPPREEPERAERPKPPGRPLLSATFVLSGAVAAAYAVLGLADGGFEAADWAQATILVWWTVLVALLARAWPRSPIPLAAVVAGACLLGLTALTGASIAWTSDLGAAYEDALRGAGYLGIFVLTAIAARAGAGRAFLGGLAVGLLAICALSLLSRLEPGLVESRDEAEGLRVSGGRLSWPLGYWNAVGACAAAAVPLFLWLAVSAGAPLRRALAAAAIPAVVLTLFFTGSRAGLVAQAVAIAVLLFTGPRRVTLVSMVAIVFIPATLLISIAGGSPDLVNGENTGAAAAAGDRLLVFTVLATILVGVAVRLGDGRLATLHLPVVGARRALVVTAVLAVGLSVLASLNADAVDRLRSIDDPPSTSTATVSGTRLQDPGSSGRTQFWDAALDAFASEPVRGIGAGGYESYWAVNGTLDFTVTHAHSVYFESAAELGLFGPLLAVGFFLVPALAGVRRLRAPTSWAGSETATGAVGAGLAVLAAGITVAAVDWSWDLPAAFIPAVIAGGFLCAPPIADLSAVPAVKRRRRRRRERSGRLGKVAVALVVVAAAAASIAGSAVLLLTERALSRSEAELADGKPKESAAEAREAADLMPFAAAPQRQLALAELARDRPVAARRAIAEAQDRARADWELWFLAAGIEFSSDRLAPGIYALSRAEALNPKAPSHLFVPPSSASR